MSQQDSTRISSRSLNEFEGDLSLLKVDINDKMNYFNGQDISTSRTGYEPVSGLLVFQLAKKARERADLLINAADAMDLRIELALERQS